MQTSVLSILSVTLLASATTGTGISSETNINTSVFFRIANSSSEQLVIDNADGRLTYYTRIYKANFTTISKLYLLDTWCYWEPGWALKGSYRENSQLGIETVYVHLEEYVPTGINKRGGAIHPIFSWPCATGSEISLTSSLSSSPIYQGVFATSTAQDSAYDLGFGARLIVSSHGTHFFSLSYGDQVAGSNYFQDPNHFSNIGRTFTHTRYDSSSTDVYSNYWRNDFSYGSSGQNKQQFHAMVLFEMSSQTVNCSENAMLYQYRFTMQSRYMQTIWFISNPALGTEFQYSVNCSAFTN